MRQRLLLLLLWLSALTSRADGLTAVDYIQQWKEEAIYQMVVHRIPASITLAQGMLESGNGNSRLAVNGNNHFGIKCHSDWTGKTIREDDETRQECFRKYDHARDSFDDHSLFLKKKRYEPLFRLDVDDYKGWARTLKECGYATNPKYPQLLIRIIEENDLTRFDQVGMDLIARNEVPSRSSGGSPDLAGRTHDKPRRPHHDGKDVPADISVSSGRQVSLSENRIRFILARSGDSAESIARDLEMAPWQIRKYNDLEKGESIREGEVVYLQPKRNRARQANYTVKQGDSLRSISQHFGIKISRLCRKNQIAPGTEPAPGTVLRMR